MVDIIPNLCGSADTVHVCEGWRTDNLGDYFSGTVHLLFLFEEESLSGLETAN